MTHGDYETIDMDTHFGLSVEDKLTLLEARVKTLKAENEEYRRRLNEQQLENDHTRDFEL